MDLDAVLKFKPDEVVGLKRPAEDAGDSDRAAKRAAPDHELTDTERMERLMDDAAEVENFDGQVLKRVTKTLRRCIKKNSEMRSKFPDDPRKFMESEVDVDEAINNTMALASTPELYEDFVALGGVEMLTGLLSHENSDIALAVIALVYDMTDIDESYDDSGVLDGFIEQLMKGELLSVLVANLNRFDEKVKEDADGIHKLMGILENLVEVQPIVTVRIIKTTKIIEWLLERILVKEMDANKLYASELLSIFIQDIEEGQKMIMECNGMDAMLRAVSRYKKRDPRSNEEGEMAENLFSCICTLLMNPSHLDMFLNVEGVGLMVIMIKGKMNARCSALKVLNFALSNTESTKLCEQFVDTLGLKTIFPCFMKSPSAKYLKGCGTTARSYEENACSIVAALFDHLDKTGTNHDRLLNKFVENDYAKMERLYEFHTKYNEELARTDEVIKKETMQLMVEGDEVDDEMENEFYMRRLQSGLFTLHLVDTVIAHTIVSDLSGARERLELLLRQSGQGYESIVAVLQDKLDNGGADPHGVIQKFIDDTSADTAGSSA